MYLLIDAGNSRIKYGCHDGRQWLVRDRVDIAALRLPDGFVPQRILVSSVVRDDINEALSACLGQWSAPIEWLQASAVRCGLRCDYQYPQRLGPDRWAAAIGAWTQLRQACLIVCAGTATTIDMVRDDGVYAGGSILPGLSMMLKSLAAGTARLPLAGGQFAIPARNTDDAIRTGCLLAQVGAIREMAKALPDHSPILLAGGHAAALLPYLGERALHVPWLVLDGLLQAAVEPLPAGPDDSSGK